MSTPRIFTIGHSNHSLAQFLALIEGAGVSSVLDVRSQPFSRWVPHFNRKALEAALAENGVAYRYLGRALGGRPVDPSLMRDGKPDYALMARSPEFATGLERVIEASAADRVALLCAERDPVDCHRFHLIGRELDARRIPVAHILATGAIEAHPDTLRRASGRACDDLFGLEE